MSGRPVISAYTPSNTDPELLQRIFVQRQRLLNKITDRLARSMTTGDRHHVLLVGPRGSGKTHMVSLAAHALRNRPELSDVMRIAWLGEDDTVAGLIDIALGIADRLADEYPDEFETDYRTPVRGLPADDAAESILNTIVDRLGKRNIILIMENMDRAFCGLGDMGQKKWRAFLQEKARIATLATSQQLFDGIASRDEPFFGFFDIHHLKPLSRDDAGELIRRISVEQDNTELVDFLNSAEGRYRIRALHHLAGGNHRMYVLLAEFLTKDSLGDLVEAFEQLAEDLTPYFQELVRSLPPQQAKIVQCLCNADGAKTVKEIAEETFIAERNCSKQLGSLKQKGYVQSQKRGKESFYDMAEPLMRLCLEVKNQRGRPLKLVARFLRAWFPESKLREGLEQPADAQSRGDQYRYSALETDLNFETSITAELDREIREHLNRQQYENAIELACELQCVDPSSAELVSAEVAFRRQDYVSSIEALTAVIDMPDAPAEQKAQALFNRGVTHGQQDDSEQARADYTAVIDMPDAPAEQKAQALFNRGVTHGRQGDREQELADYTAVIDMPDAPAEQKAKALLNRGVTHTEQGDREQALAVCTAVIDMPDAPAEEKAMALLYRGATHGRQGDTEQELADYTAVVEMPDAPAEQKAKALLYRGATHGRQGDREQALTDYMAVIDMPDAPAEQKAKALFNRGVTHSQQGDSEQALADYTAVIDMPDAPAEQKAQALFNRGVTHGQQGDSKQALADFTAVIDMPDAPAEQKAKALLNRGSTHGRQGDREQALADYTAVIDMPDAPAEQEATAMSIRGAFLWRSGDYKHSQESFEAALAVAEVSSQYRTAALFGLPEPMIANAGRDQVIVALESAFRNGDADSAGYGGTPDDLLSMVLGRGHQEWREYIAELVPVYVNNNAVAKLGQGVTQTIELLDTGGYSEMQLDVWNDAWQEAGKDCDDLELPLRSLDAAIDAIKTKSDRPLFRLPLEIREIVRPLLTKSLEQ